MQTLPVDEILPEVARLLSGDHRQLIIEAPPGAGKTTRIPPLLLDQHWAKERKVYVSEPRRIAARLSATRVASERELRLGGPIGYRVRFDDKTSKATRLIYLTEGLLLRNLLDDSSLLSSTCAIVLDEVHERSADLDAVMALLARRQAEHQHLRVIAMSATLDVAALTGFWPQAPVLTSEGRAYPVDVRYAPKQDERRIEVQVRSAVKERFSEEGDMLVFLPGAAEIRRTAEALEEGINGHLPQSEHVDILPMHGDLSIKEQARVVARSDGKRRIVLSTNVAESSVTIPGVTTVIDSGLARVARHDAFSGAQRLELEAVSQARCEQRAGRAGRTAKGVCIRLYTRGQFQARPAQETPELLREDLAELLLLLRSSGIDERELNWASPPPQSSWESAREQLGALGALADDGSLTALGRLMAQLPLPPRLSRTTIEAARLGIPETGAEAAALLSERDLLRRQLFGRAGQRQEVEAGESDLDLRLELLEEARLANFDPRRLRQMNVDAQSARRVDRVASQLVRQLNRASARWPEDLARLPEDSATASQRLTRALLTGFFDRVASRRSGRKLSLSNGSQGQLAEESCVSDAALVLCLAADFPRGRRGGAVIRQVVRLDPEWLLDWCGDSIEAHEEYSYDPERDSVDELSQLRYGKVVLDESRQKASPCDGAAQALVRVASTRGAATFDPDDHLASVGRRLRLLKEYLPSTFDGHEAILETDFLEYGLLRGAELCTSLGELRKLDLESIALGSLPKAVSQALSRETPAEVKLHGGRRLRIHYEEDRAPWAESRLQDFFSMNETPRLCQGRLPLSLHLLAPNKRAVQVTSDLAGFWERHYPELRRQLMRRYPRHLWPEDGRSATPPQPGRIR